MPDHFPCLLRIQVVLFKIKEKPNFADISLFIVSDTYYIISALFCMAKRIAEIFPGDRTRANTGCFVCFYTFLRIQALVLKLAFGSSEGTTLACAMRLHPVPSSVGDTAFSRECLLKVSLSLVSQPGMV